MLVALTGVSGFIGSVVARRLREAGHAVRGLVRATSRVDHLRDLDLELVTGDQADRSAWPALLDGADAVVHNAFDWAALRSGDLPRHLDANVAAAIELLAASRPAVFVHMSSIAVHHDMLPRWDGRPDETHPTRPGSRYGAAKAAVEAHLFAERAEHGRRVVALRPCAVYGMDPEPARTIGWPIVERVRQTRRFDRPGGGKFVHVDDVAAATVAACAHPEAVDVAVNLADCYARWADLATMAAEILGVEAEIDRSSPAEPRNVFAKDAARALGVPLDRGHAGLRTHLERVAAAQA